VSVRSGARASMPGMMDTVLNLGLNDETVEALAKQSGDRRFAYDSYRASSRCIPMWCSISSTTTSRNSGGAQVARRAHARYRFDRDDWVDVVALYKSRVEEEQGTPFPQNPRDQLWGAIARVGSWMNARAITYRRLHNIPESWGTAVNVQAMVFGNYGRHVGDGVAFTRNPSTGEKRLYGEFLINAQGEDVVAASAHRRRSPKREEGVRFRQASMETAMPAAFKKLTRIYGALEKHYRDMQDMEFTVEQGKLWMLQTRNASAPPRPRSASRSSSPTKS